MINTHKKSKVSELFHGNEKELRKGVCKIENVYDTKFKLSSVSSLYLLNVQFYSTI